MAAEISGITKTRQWKDGQFLRDPEVMAYWSPVHLEMLEQDCDMAGVLGLPVCNVCHAVTCENGANIRRDGDKDKWHEVRVHHWTGTTACGTILVCPICYAEWGDYEDAEEDKCGLDCYPGPGLG